MLRVRLLGQMGVGLGGDDVGGTTLGRPWALFAYLALHPGLHPRGELAARFWPDVLDSSARASLRSAVWTLRRGLGPRAAELLVADRDQVGLAADGLWVDVVEFAELAAAGRLEEAVEHCRGELLSGIEDDWALVARDAHRDRLGAVLEQLAARAEDTGDAATAVGWTRRQCEADPLSEEAHRRLMSRLAASGDRAAALVVHRTIADRLRRELGVAPSPATRELAERLRAEPATTASLPPPHVPAGLPSLVGRSAELDELAEIWAVAAGGRGRAVLLRGEAGIGKTRLATELRVRAASGGARTGACAALDLGGAAPFGLWAEMIRDLLPSLAPPPAEAAWPGDLARLAPELAVRFDHPLDRDGGVPPDLERARLMEAVVALVTWAARDRPLLLVFEDTHLADRSSLELTGYVARRIAGLPVLCVLTRRDLPRSADADLLEHALRARGVLAAELELAPLDARSVAALARDVAALDDADVEHVVRSCEGNALLAVETARALERGDRAPSATLRGAVRGAFATLSPESRRLAEFAAVAARELARDEVELLPPASAEAVSALVDTGLLVSAAGRVGFRHALLREAVYADLAEPLRLELHEQWARVLLEQHRHAAEVARHLLLAERHDRAAEQLVLAAADARAVGALVEAAGYLGEAIQIAGDQPEILLELAEVEAWCGRRDRAEESFDRALAELADAEPLVLARTWLRSARWYHGPICVPPKVLECCRQALALLDDAGLDALAERREGIAALAWAEAVAGGVEEAERLLVALNDLVSGGESDDLATFDIGHARALALMRRGRFAEAYAPSIAAGEAIGRAGRPDLAYGCWLNAAGAAAAAGDHERAQEFLDRGLEALHGQGLAVLEAQAIAARSFILLRLDRIEEALAAAALEQEIADRTGRPELIAMAAHDRGLAALAAGDHAAAAELLASALVDGAPISRPLTRLARAEALLGAGRADEAEAELRATALEPVRMSDFPDALVPRLARLQGLIAEARGDRELALRRLAESVDGWRRQVARAAGSEAMTAVLADLGRPVVGLVEPDRELARVSAEHDALAHPEGAAHAVVP